MRHAVLDPEQVPAGFTLSGDAGPPAAEVESGKDQSGTISKRPIDEAPSKEPSKSDGKSSSNRDGKRPRVEPEEAAGAIELDD